MRTKKIIHQTISFLKKSVIIWVFVYALLLTFIISIVLIMIFRILPQEGEVIASVNDGYIKCENAQYEGSIFSDEIRIEFQGLPVISISGETNLEFRRFSKYQKAMIVVHLDPSQCTDKGYFNIYNSHSTPFEISSLGIASYDYDSKNSVTISSSQPLKIRYEGCSLKKDGKEITELNSDIRFKASNVALEIGLPAYRVSWSGSSDLFVRDAKEIIMNGSGSVSLYHTATPQVFDYLGEASLTGNLKAKIIEKTGESNSTESPTIEIRGKVTQATIQGFSLFQSFTAWLYDNKYVIPSMLLTVFSGAISLATKRKSY